MQMNPVQKSLSKKFGARPFKTLAAIVTSDCIEKHDLISEYCEESKFGKNSTRISRRVKIRKSGHEDRAGRTETQTKDRDQDMKEIVQIQRKEKLYQGVLE